MDRLRERINQCRQWDPRHYAAFRVGGVDVGWIRLDMRYSLQAFPDLFRINSRAVILNPQLNPDQRTAAMEDVARALRAHGTIRGWRAEYYAVASAFEDEPLFLLERAAVPLFGTRSYGVHVNGYVGRGDQQKIWVARRSRDKATFPGALDHIVAGGMAAGYGALETVIKEAEEEAGIPKTQAGKARPVGALHYMTELKGEAGLRNDAIFIYDVELPARFIPRNQDGEVEEFMLLSPDEVLALLRSDADFKFNTAPVFIDFLIRHGHLRPDMPGYLSVNADLRGLGGT